MTMTKKNMCDVSNETPNCMARIRNVECLFCKSSSTIPVSLTGWHCRWNPYDSTGISYAGSLCCCTAAITDAVLARLEIKDEFPDVL